MKVAAAIAIVIPIAAALLGNGQHPQVHADTPTANASQPPNAASQALRRYTLQLLHILSNPNKWEGYRQAITHCGDVPASLAEIGAANDASPLDRALIALNQDLCVDLEQRMVDARTVGLLVNEPEAMSGYALLAGAINNYVHLVDHLGRVVHSWQGEKPISHARLLDNGNLLIGYGGALDVYDSITELDPEGNVVWEYAHADELHHDFLNMPNGNVLMVTRRYKTMEEAIAAGVNPDIVPPAGMEHDYIIEVRPTGSEGGEVVWEWDTWDYLTQDFDASKPNYTAIAARPELIDGNFSDGRLPLSSEFLHWTWINAIDYNPELDQIALSPRQFNEVWIIDHSATTEEAPTLTGGNSGKGGALLYRWGNPRAYGHGAVSDQRLFGQHHTQWIAPGLPGESNILIFNNGYERGPSSPDYSSIEEIVTFVDGYGYRREPGKPYPPADPVWTYTAETPTDFYSGVISGVQRLPNGNTLICDGMRGKVFQVTPEGKTVWEYVYPMERDTPLKQGERPRTLLSLPRGDTLFTNGLYRAYWYAPDHPGLQNLDLTPGDTIELYE